MLLPGKEYAYLYVVALAEANKLEFPLSKSGFLYHIETHIQHTFQAKPRAIRYYDTKVLYNWLQEAMPNNIFKRDVPKDVLCERIDEVEENRGKS